MMVDRCSSDAVCACINDGFVHDDHATGQSDTRLDTAQPAAAADDVTVQLRSTAVNHCRTPAAGHVTGDVALPSYSASVSARACLPSPCPPITSASLRPHRKLCVECCLQCVVMATSVRALMACVVLVGVASMVAGIALGAVNMTVGHDYFTLSIIFVGQS